MLIHCWNTDCIVCKIKIFKSSCEFPFDAVSLLFCCSSHHPVSSKQGQEPRHDTTLLNASGDFERSCLFSLVQYWTLEVIVHYWSSPFWTACQECRIGLHDSPLSSKVYWLEGFFECLPLIDLFHDLTIDLFHDVAKDEYLFDCAPENQLVLERHYQPRIGSSEWWPLLYCLQVTVSFHASFYTPF